MKRFGLLGSILGVLPTFVVLSVIGCLVGKFVFGIPLDRLGVAVSVPLVVGFLLTRVLIMLVPMEEPKHNRPVKHTRADLASAALLLCAVFSCADLLVSSGVYVLIGFGSLSVPTLLLSLAFFLASAVLLLACLAVMTLEEPSARIVLRHLVKHIARVFWDFLWIPTDISSRIYGRFLHAA